LNSSPPIPKKRGAPAKVDEKAWIRAAQKVLARQGVDAVRIDSLARQLGISRGSFYWHFANRDALLGRILEQWRQTSTLALIERLEARPLAPLERLRSLIAIAFDRSEKDPGQLVEFAIRQWGRSDPRARQALAEVDGLRLRYFARLFAEMGFDEDAARTRARLANSFMRVAPTFPDQRGAQDIADAIAILAEGRTAD